MNFESFLLGYIFCMLSDILFSASNCFVQYAFKLRSERKQGENK